MPEPGEPQRLLIKKPDAPAPIAGLATTTQQDFNIGAALLAAYWILVAIGEYFWDEEENGPPPGITYVHYSFEPADSWKCPWHPEGSCYGPEWGCNGLPGCPGG